MPKRTFVDLTRQITQQSGTTAVLSGITSHVEGIFVKGIEIDTAIAGLSGTGHTLTFDGVKIRLLDGGPKAGLIGVAEDGSYNDGLFKDFTATTPVGTPIDRFNELFAALCPPPAPSLTGHDGQFAGVPGKLSFDAANPISGYTHVSAAGALPAVAVDGTFVLSGKRKGVIAPATVTGLIASNVAADGGSPTASYPAGAFGDADKGFLRLELNGIVVRSADLSVAATYNDAGTGFILSAPLNNRFPNGNAFNVFRYRTGSWRVSTADMRLGHNHVRIIHEYAPGQSYLSDYVDWVADGSTVQTTFAGESMSVAAMTGQKFLSGIRYHTGGSFSYANTVSNTYRNTYSAGNGLTYNITPQLVQPAADAPPPNGGNESAAIPVTKTITLRTSGVRLVGETVSAGLGVDRTVQPDLSSPGASPGNLLVDNLPAQSTLRFDAFTDENHRLPSNADFTSVALAPGLWDSTQSLLGAPGYGDGLQVGGGLAYPSLNFGSITHAYPNPDYSPAAGERNFVRVFAPAGSATHSNFIIRLEATAPVGFIPAGSPFTAANQAKLEITAPTQTGWLDGWADFVTGQFATGNGGRNSTQGAGRATGVDWGLTIGTRSTANSGNRIYMRLTVPANFDRNIRFTSATLTFT